MFGNHLVKIWFVDTRSQILNTAYEMLGQHGLEALHARTVAAELKINHATVHYYFKSRNDLLMALVQFATEKFVDDRAKVANAAKNAQALEAELALYEAYGRPQSRFFRVFTSLFVAGQSNPALMEAVQNFANLWVSGVADAVKRTRDSGTKVKKGAFRDPEILAGTLIGLGMLAQLKGDSSMTDQIDSIAETLIS